MRIWTNVGIDLLGMAELQTTREVYLLPCGMTGIDRLRYPLRHLGTAHAWLFTSLCRFTDIDEQTKGLCYWCNINIQRQCSGDLGTEVIQNFFFMCVYTYIACNILVNNINISLTWKSSNTISFRYNISFFILPLEYGLWGVRKALFH